MAITFVRASWVDSIIERLDRTVSRTPITKTTDNITGAETLSEGTPGNISAVFLQRNDKWDPAREGLTEEADAYLMVKDSVTLNKDDLITVDTRKYRVHDIITRYTDSNQETAVYKYATLFLNE